MQQLIFHVFLNTAAAQSGISYHMAELRSIGVYTIIIFIRPGQFLSVGGKDPAPHMVFFEQGLSVVVIVVKKPAPVDYGIAAEIPGHHGEEQHKYDRSKNDLPPRLFPDALHDNLISAVRSRLVDSGISDPDPAFHRRVLFLFPHSKVSRRASSLLPSHPAAGGAPLIKVLLSICRLPFQDRPADLPLPVTP